MFPVTGDGTGQAGYEGWPAAAFGEALRVFRDQGGLTRQQLARAAGIDRSVLSRLERGQYRHRLSERILTDLSAALTCGDALFEAAGRPAPDMQKLITDPALALALANPEAAHRALRKLHLAEIASSAAGPVFVPNGRAVDVVRLWKAVRERLGLDSARPPEVGPGSHAQTPVARRFLISHATAHLLLETECKWPYIGSESETEASELGGLLLTPPDLLLRLSERPSAPGWIRGRRTPTGSSLRWPTIS